MIMRAISSEKRDCSASTGLLNRTALGVLVICAGFAVAARAQTPDLVIEDVTIVSPERAAPLEHAYVRIGGGLIMEVSNKPLQSEETLDGAGLFLIPGLIDSHTHLGNIPGLVGESASARPDLVATANAQIPRSYLFHGFTTVLDLGGRAESSAMWNALEVRPDAYFCGKAPLFDGYSFDGPLANEYFLFLPDQAGDLPPGTAPADHTPEAVVARMHEDGAICVKAYMESGFGGAAGTLPVPTMAMMQALVAAAHARGLPVFIHANSVPAQAFAVEAGADVIAHGMWNGHAPGRDLGLAAQSTLREVVDNEIGYQPTMQVLAGIADLFDADFLSDARLQDVTPTALLDWYASEEGGWFRREVAAEVGDVAGPNMNDGGMSRGAQVLAALAEGGARLLFGTDTPGSPTYANPPGLNARKEMQRWIEAGVSERQLFRALTIENAAVMGMDGEIGTVEAGKAANILLLRSNPLENVDAYDTIQTVILHGRLIARDELSARKRN